MVSRVATIVAVLAAIIGIILALASRYSKATGTIALLHIGIPWGLKFEDVPDFSGKYAVITGANSGLGKGTAMVLAENGQNVIMACRSMPDCDKAAEEVKQKASASKRNKAKDTQVIKTMKLDLSSLESVEEFIKNYKASGLPIDHLYLNAGIMFPEYALTKDGIESQFGVNHVGHQALALGLLDIVKKSSDPAIISVSSFAHYTSHGEGVYLTLDKINDQNLYNRFMMYGQSKLANILMAKEMAKLLDAKGIKNIRVHAVHPGGVKGRLNRNLLSGSFLQAIDDVVQYLIYWTEEEGALTSIAPVLKKDIPNGSYFVPVGRVVEPSAFATNAELASKLWKFTQDIIKEKRPSLFVSEI